MTPHVDSSMENRVINGAMMPVAKIPRVSESEFRRTVIDRVAGGCRLSALFGRPSGRSGVSLYALLSDPDTASIEVWMTEIGGTYAALTPECPQAHWFEREIAEQWGVKPHGHPWLKPIRFHRSYVDGRDAWGRTSGEPILPGVMPAGQGYFEVRGEGIHEVAVGPVHAGVIEPGHFRFQCHGEHVFHLEIELGYQYRGIERRLVGGPNRRTLHYMETLAGDTSVGHATAYCQALEALAGQPAPARAQAIRGIALELERLANHTGDLGALAGDVGYLPTLSYCGRLRGDFLNTTLIACGNRFGRGLVRPGGVRFDLDAARAMEMVQKLEPALAAVGGAVELLWQSASVMARFEGTGRVSRDDAVALGLVGVAGRACGVESDVRHDFPAGIHRFAQIPVSSGTSGDVFARAHVRWHEVRRSGAFAVEQLQTLPEGEVMAEIGPLSPGALAVSMVEGWRGEICHVAITDDAGRLAHYKVVDPSFHNWYGLAMSLRDQPISDFPLCNKSFNLSYCGHDL